MSRAVSAVEALAIDEVAAWVSEVVTASLTTWVKHSSAASSAVGGSPRRSAVGGGSALGTGASDALREAVADLTLSLGGWMDGLAERRAALAARQTDALELERALRTFGTLSVTVRGAAGLADQGGAADCHAAELVVRGVERRTRAGRGASPSWEQTLHFDGQLGALLERPLLARLWRLAPAAGAGAGGGGDGGDVLVAELALSLLPLLEAGAQLRAAWDHLALSATAAGSLALSASFRAAELTHPVTQARRGTLRVRVRGAGGLPAGLARELGALVRVSVGGQRRETSALLGATANAELCWEETLSFDGALGDLAGGAAHIEVVALGGGGGGGGEREAVLCAGALGCLAASLADVEAMAAELDGVTVTVQLAPRGRVGLSYEWTEAADVAVAEELHTAFPLLRPVLAIKRLKRDVPIGARARGPRPPQI
jgi:hypothetical protein